MINTQYTSYLLLPPKIRKHASEYALRNRSFCAKKTSNLQGNKVFQVFQISLVENVSEPFWPLVTQIYISSTSELKIGCASDMLSMRKVMIGFLILLFSKHHPSLVKASATTALILSPITGGPLSPTNSIRGPNPSRNSL